MKKLLVSALVALLLSGCITNPRGPGLTASLYTWNDRDNPVATRTTSATEGFFDLFYGSVLLSDLLTLQPDLDTRDAVPYLLEICDAGVCHYSILFPSWFVYRNGNVAGFATINELTTAFYYSVMDRPQGEVLYYLDQYAALVMAGEVPGYEDGTIDYEDVGRLDYHLNPDQVDLVESPTLISIVENSINDGQILSIVNVLTGTAGGGGGGGGGGGSGGGGSGNNTGGVTPTAIAETIEENTTLNGSLPGNDPDGLPATDAFAVTTPPDHGVLSLNADSGAYAYQPDADFTGADSFRAAVTDVGGYTTTVTLSITVTSAGGGNDTGGITPTTLSETITEDSELNDTLPSNDPDGLPASGAFAVGTGPADGTLSLDADTGAYTYTPAADFNGADSFTARVTDNGGNATTVAVNVTVTPVDDGGVTPTSLSETMEGNTTLSGTLPANDPDGLATAGAYAVSADPSNGALSLNANTGAFGYTPAANYSGSDSFSVEVTDADGDTSTVTVNVTVSPADPGSGGGGTGGGGSGGGGGPTDSFPLVTDYLTFDGINDYVTIPHSPAYELDEGSISIWFNSTRLADFDTLFSKDASFSAEGGHLTIDFTAADQIEVRLQRSTAPANNIVGSSGLVLDDGDWHHVVFTFGSGGMALYVDGALQDTNPYTGGMRGEPGDTPNREPIALGASRTGSNPGSAAPSGGYFDGLMDDVEIFNTALTAAEVTDLYQSYDGSGTGGGGGSGGGGSTQGPNAHCIPGAYTGGDAMMNGVAFAYYCPDGAVYMASECPGGACSGQPIASRACTTGQASEGCTVVSNWSNDIYTCPNRLAYEGSECSPSGNGTFSCVAN